MLLNYKEKDLMTQLGWTRYEERENDETRVLYTRQIENSNDMEVAGFKVNDFGDGVPVSGIVRNADMEKESFDSIEPTDLDTLSDFALGHEIFKFVFTHILKEK